MRTAFICSAFAALSCGGNGGICGPYQHDADLFGYCLTTHVVEVATAAQAAEVCAQASGKWQGECRTAWVGMAVTQGTPVPTLLNVCTTDDCRFLVLDRRPEADLQKQMAACAQAGRYVEDCRGHARQRWDLAHPDSPLPPPQPPPTGPEP